MGKINVTVTRVKQLVGQLEKVRDQGKAGEQTQSQELQLLIASLKNDLKGADGIVTMTEVKMADIFNILRRHKAQL